MKILDVGCGLCPKGDVNVDLYPDARARLDGLSIPVKKINNFIKADACYLPFRDKTFTKTYSIEVLEHIENIRQALKEIIRVTEGEVILELPHRYWRTRAHPWKVNQSVHKHLFGVQQIRKSIRSLGYEAWVRVDYGYPFRLFLNMPCHLTIHIFLRAYKKPYDQKDFARAQRNEKLRYRIT